MRGAVASGNHDPDGSIAATSQTVNVALGASGFISEHPAFNRAFVLGAPILFVIAFAGSASLQAWAFAFDTRTLVAAQAVRVGGIAFLAVYAVGKLDGTFAWWAGSLDCVVGFSALFAASYLTPVRTAWQRNLLIAWMVPGIVDFLVAIPVAMTARLHDPASMIALTRPPLSDDRVVLRAADADRLRHPRRPPLASAPTGMISVRLRWFRADPSPIDQGSIT